MYFETFGLTEAPFQLTPDSRYLFFSKAHKRAKAYMDYAVWKRDGFIVITGEIGSGKTTLINKLLSEIEDNVEVIRIFQTQLNELEFLQAMLYELGYEDDELIGMGKVQLLHKLNHYLLDAYSKNKHVVLIVDEGQNLSTKVLEEIRMLSGLEVEQEKLLNTILVGQPEMNEVLDQPRMTQLVQRIRLRFHVGALKAEETYDYIDHRLMVAGLKPPKKVFHDDTYPLIQKYTGGIPRKINVLCDTAMVCAYADDKVTVGLKELNDALTELQWLSSKNKKKAETKLQTHNINKGLDFSDSPADTFVNHELNEVLLTMVKYIGDLSERMTSIDKQLKKINKSLTEDKSGKDEETSTKKSNWSK
ncbi:MAG: AAA family ATPase [Gammaproteobacteria bacterium]|nr:AAA family ATPase [Gammaproteobacteria bacterium]